MEGYIVKTMVMLVIVAAILLFVTGCGPGQPFEIEGRCSPQTATSAYAAAVR
jgi:hypothetical protein